MKIAHGSGRALILAAWAMYAAALFLPAVDVDLFKSPHLVVAQLHGWEAAIFSLAIVRGVWDDPSLLGLLYLLIPLGNVALLLCPLELLVHRHLRRMAAPITLLSALAFACIVLLPLIEGPMFAARHCGHFLMLAAFAVLTAGNVVLVNEERAPAPRAPNTVPPPS